MNFLPEKKFGVPSHNFVKKNVLWEKGDEIVNSQLIKLAGQFQTRNNSGNHLKIERKKLHTEYAGLKCRL